MKPLFSYFSTYLVGKSDFKSFFSVWFRQKWKLLISRRQSQSKVVWICLSTKANSRLNWILRLSSASSPSSDRVPLLVFCKSCSGIPRVLVMSFYKFQSFGVTSLVDQSLLSIRFSSASSIQVWLLFPLSTMLIFSFLLCWS